MTTSTAQTHYIRYCLICGTQLTPEREATDLDTCEVCAICADTMERDSADSAAETSTSEEFFGAE